jgi:D-glycero-alpha-D-manno-heptose-7-phosphate kinase
LLITRTPLRVSFLGGGTDFPWYFEEYGGAVISAAIDKYIYLSAIPSYNQQETYLKYSNYERVSSYEDIEHPIFREVLKKFTPGSADFSVMSDIPEGNGLASSSAFTVGLINLVSSMTGSKMTKIQLALEAISVEVDLLQEPIGVQDQCAAAFGGLRCYHFSGPRDIASELLVDNLENFPFDLSLVKVGLPSRSASALTQQQKDFVNSNAKALLDLHELAELTRIAAEEYPSNPSSLASFVNEGWSLKKSSNPFATNEEIESVLKTGFRNGALAGKLLGAGGSGFVLFLIDKGLGRSFSSVWERDARRSLGASIDVSGSKLTDLSGERKYVQELFD